MKKGGEGDIFFLEEGEHEVGKLDQDVLYECCKLVVVRCPSAVVEQECVQHTQHGIALCSLQ